MGGWDGWVGGTLVYLMGLAAHLLGWGRGCGRLEVGGMGCTGRAVGRQSRGAVVLGEMGGEMSGWHT